jgi:hypothetical protein
MVMKKFKSFEDVEAEALKSKKGKTVAIGTTDLEFEPYCLSAELLL